MNYNCKEIVILEIYRKKFLMKKKSKIIRTVSLFNQNKIYFNLIIYDNYIDLIHQR